MQKFLFKFFILFVLTISTLFFVLIEFQKLTMERAQRNLHPQAGSEVSFEFDMVPHFPPQQGLPMSHPAAQDLRMPRPVVPQGFEMPHPGMNEALTPYANPPHASKMRSHRSSSPLKNPPFFVPAFLIVLLSSLFVFFLLKYLDKNFISPLVEIKEKTKNIKDGFLDVEFKTKSEDETVRETFETLNSMVLGLKEKEKFRDNFISMLTHDLRTPILAQERAIAILKDEFKGHELLDGMLENNEEYLSMINLIIETFSASDIKIKKENFDLSKLVATVVLALKPAANAKNIDITVKIPKDFTVFADYISFHRIFMNLISNSIDNINEGKAIKIEAVKKDGKSIITVFDNGNGIDEKTLGRIFNKYASFKKADGKTVSGLGLYIASELVKKNGGTIDVETVLGSFTKFIIKI